ncbi:MAG: biotin synthase BioB [bacterium]
MIPSFEYVIKHHGITQQEAMQLATLDNRDVFKLFEVTNGLRQHFKGNSVNLCSIINAKSGLCPEDCRFCAQSVHYKTQIKSYPLLNRAIIVEKAIHATGTGARGFSIVTSGYGIDNKSELDDIAETIRAIAEKTPLYRCASLGVLTEQELAYLRDAGLTKYHHNLETSRSFFPNVCTTHPYDDDVEAIKSAKSIGLNVCSGGVFGIGESWDDRIELAFTLKQLDVDSIPINFLIPIKGTPLEGTSYLSPLECLKIIAIFRLILPDKDIVICGGREVNLRDLQSMIFYAGANGMMVGGYLTTPGRPVEDDIRMIHDLGMEITKPVPV